MSPSWVPRVGRGRLLVATLAFVGLLGSGAQNAGAAQLVAQGISVTLERVALYGDQQ